MTRVLFAFGVLVLAAGCGDESPSPTAPPATPRPSRVTLSTYPTSVLFSGSSVQVTARVANDRGEAVSVPITFTSDSGTFDPATAQTSSIGLATVTFTGDRDTTIIASAGGAQSEQQIQAVAPYTLRMSASTDSRTNIADVTLSAVPNVLVVNPPAPARMTVDCGDGVLHEMPVSGPPRTQRCTYSAPGDYTTFGEAVAANGWSVRQSVLARVGNVTVQAPLAIASVSQITQGIGYVEVGFIASGATPVQNVEWSFGDGSGANSNRLNENHIYRAAGSYTVRVSGTSSSGSTLTASREIAIAPCDAGRLCVSSP